MTEETLKTISAVIENEAKNLARIMLGEGKKAFEKASKNKDSDELNRIVDFFRGRCEFSEVWEGCPMFRAEVVDKVVVRWKEIATK